MHSAAVVVLSAVGTLCAAGVQPDIVIIRLRHTAAEKIFFLIKTPPFIISCHGIGGVPYRLMKLYIKAEKKKIVFYSGLYVNCKENSSALVCALFSLEFLLYAEMLGFAREPHAVKAELEDVRHKVDYAEKVLTAEGGVKVIQY